MTSWHVSLQNQQHTMAALKPRQLYFYCCLVCLWRWVGKTVTHVRMTHGLLGFCHELSKNPVRSDILQRLQPQILLTVRRNCKYLALFVTATVSCSSLTTTVIKKKRDGQTAIAPSKKACCRKTG